MKDPVTIERSDLWVLLKLIEGHEPVDGSLIPLAVERATLAAIGGQRTTCGFTAASDLKRNEVTVHVDPLLVQQFEVLDPQSFVEVAEPEPTFEDFYAVYPLKKKKPDALRAWSKAVKRADPRAIMEGARAWRAHWDEVPRSEMGTFPGYPATWLNNDCWNDEIVPHAGRRSKVAATRQNLAEGGRQIEQGETFAERMRQAAHREIGS